MPIDTANENAKALLNDKGGLFDENVCDWDKLREKVKRDGMRNGYLMAIDSKLARSRSLLAPLRPSSQSISASGSNTT